VAIIGAGNCASSLVQGVQFYKDAKDDDRVPGLMHVNLGGYHVSDIEFSAAFDVVDTKVGKDLLDRHIVDDPRMIDVGMIWGTGFPADKGGPMKWADLIGLSRRLYGKNFY